jgi:hypothetical protein
MFDARCDDAKIATISHLFMHFIQARCCIVLVNQVAFPCILFYSTTMSTNTQDASPLLEVIPADLCTPEQVARWEEDWITSPTFILRRKPSALEELKKYGDYFAVWRENDTMTYVTQFPYHRRSPSDAEQRILSFKCCYEGYKRLEFRIVGRREVAVAETAAFWICLEKAEEVSEHVFLSTGGGYFDFRSVGSQCLLHMLQLCPTRGIDLHELLLSAEQATDLVTRPYQTNLNFWSCMFEDGGAALVAGIQNRQSPLGSLALETFYRDGRTGLSDENLKLLCQIDNIGELTVSSPKEEFALFPLSAKVESLTYISISSSSLLTADLQSLNIATSKLCLFINHDDFTVPTELILSFWRRVATLGHFVELSVIWQLPSNTLFEVPVNIIHEITQAALANRNLRLLDFTDDNLNMNPHIGSLLEGLKDHQELSTIKVNVDDESFGPDYSHLRKLISHNRNITVTCSSNHVYTDGSTIDDLYSINRFYRGSADLLLKSSTFRASLVATALTEIASNDFRRSGLLLSDHVDVLHEFILFAEFEERLGNKKSSRLKRIIRVQPSRAVKKASKYY